MNTFEVYGGKRLRGELIPQGAKNEALQVICATLLTKDKVTINNIPLIRDVVKLIELLESLGVNVEYCGGNTYVFQADNIDLDYLNTSRYIDQAKTLRGSVMVVGPLLTRFGKGYIPKPGGDSIGRRRLDTHFIGLEKLGASFVFDEKESFYKVEGSKLQGTYMLLDEASLTGTANIIMASVLARGKTTIYNAACEPYIQQLCKMLNNMGAKISGIGSNLLTIEGVNELHGCQHTILPDMIEIGSFIGLAAMTRSEITIKNAGCEQLGMIPDVFRKIGIKIIQQQDDLYVPSQECYEVTTFIDGNFLTIADAPWPGFSPDLISIILVTAIQAKGSVLVHQKMFESRLFFVDKLIEMGARIILCDPHRATVIGLNREYPLRPIEMKSPDIRAGVALLIAALSADGKSLIHNVEQIDRGYHDIDTRLNKLGAKIKRIQS